MNISLLATLWICALLYTIKFLNINDKKLISLDAKDSAFKKSKEMQRQNFLSLSNFIYRVFNQIKIINSN